MKKQKVFYFFSTLFTLLILCSEISAGKITAREYEIKAAYLYYFTKFIDWPSDFLPNSGNQLYMCILGKDSFNSSLDTIENKKVRNKRLIVRPVYDTDDTNMCHILFINHSEKMRIPAILDKLKESSVVTVGEMRGFTQNGGIINFYIKNNKVRFQINADKAHNAGLRISSELLRLADIVRE